MRVVIAGDSWTGGEWDKDGKVLLHHGLQQYLSEDGFDVANLGFPGGSNLQSYLRVKNYLSMNPATERTVVLFFMTEFFREIFYYNDFHTRASDGLLEEELKYTYSELKSRWITRPYFRLNELANSYDISVYILGGCSDTVRYEDFHVDFPNLKIACNSITNLIINGDPNVAEPVFCQFINGWIDPFMPIAKDRATANDMKELLDDMELGESRVDLLNNHPEFFYPDGIHPNRLGHKKLYEYLIKQVPELQRP